MSMNNDNNNKQKREQKGFRVMTKLCSVRILTEMWWWNWESVEECRYEGQSREARAV